METNDEKKAPREKQRDYELRSEKVRSIVGQVPPSLVRYGTVVIGVALLCLFAVAYFVPYKQVYSGEAVVYEVPEVATDSVTLRIDLLFTTNRPHSVINQPITLYSGEATTQGALLSLSPTRDTEGRQEAICRFAAEEVASMAGQTVDFKVDYSSGNILKHMLPGAGS